MDLLIIDCETGGKTIYDPLFEVAGATLNPVTGDIEEAFDYIIKNANFDENAWIFSNSDLTPELVRNGFELENIRWTIQALFDTMPVAAYNSQFDFGVLENLKFRIPHKLPDPMLISTNILRLPGKYGNYKWPKVTECLDYFHIHENEPHRAAADAKLEARIIYELIKLGKFKYE